MTSVHRPTGDSAQNFTDEKVQCFRPLLDLRRWRERSSEEGERERDPVRKERERDPVRKEGEGEIQ